MSSEPLVAIAKAFAAEKKAQEEAYRKIDKRIVPCPEGGDRAAYARAMRENYWPQECVFSPDCWVTIGGASTLVPESHDRAPRCAACKGKIPPYRKVERSLMPMLDPAAMAEWESTEARAFRRYPIAAHKPSRS